VAPLVEMMCGRGTPAWSTPSACFAGALVLFLVGVATVRTSADHPIPSALAYIVDADSSDAWLASSASMARTNAWTREVVGTSARAPDWIGRELPRPAPAISRPVPRLPLVAPGVSVLSDSGADAVRELTLRIAPASGTTALVLRVVGAAVLAASVDGRSIDTTRYRRRAPQWLLQYWAPSDSGAVIALRVPANAHPELEIAARRDGLPALAGVIIPPRPPTLVPVQSGDVTIVFKRLRFSRPPAS